MQISNETLHHAQIHFSPLDVSALGGIYHCSVGKIE